MRLPELDQEAIEVRPFLRPHFYKEFPGVGKELVRYMNRDLAKIPMLGFDGSECHGNPFNVARSGPESRVLEFCRFQEVDRSWIRVLCQRW